MFYQILLKNYLELFTIKMISWLAIPDPYQWVWRNQQPGHQQHNHPGHRGKVAGPWAPQTWYLHSTEDGGQKQWSQMLLCEGYLLWSVSSTLVWDLQNFLITKLYIFICVKCLQIVCEICSFWYP